MEAVPQFALELSTKVTLIKCPSLVQLASLSPVCRLADSITFTGKQLLKKKKALPQTTTFLVFHPRSRSLLPLAKPESPSSKKVEILTAPPLQAAERRVACDCPTATVVAESSGGLKPEGIYLCMNVNETLSSSSYWQTKCVGSDPEPTRPGETDYIFWIVVH